MGQENSIENSFRMCYDKKVYVNGGITMFQKKQMIYSETQGVCRVENIVNLSATKGAPTIAYYVLKPVYTPEKVSYIPVENHKVELRELFTEDEAKALEGTEAAEKDENLKNAIHYVLHRNDKKADEEES